MKTIFTLLGCLTLLYACTTTGNSEKPSADINVENQTIISKKLPPVRIQIGDDFRYLGQFSFEIGDMAAGQRFVFADVDGKKVERLIIAQFESILPASEEIYRYSFTDAMVLRGLRFRQNAFAYSNGDALANNPQREAALTARFIVKQGYQLVDEMMVSRYLTLGNADRKSELIIFYIENADDSGCRIADFYDGENETDIWKTISDSLHLRAMENFTILEE